MLKRMLKREKKTGYLFEPSGYPMRIGLYQVRIGVIKVSDTHMVAFLEYPMLHKKSANAK